MTRSSDFASAAIVCRLLSDAPASGAWNMAVDEVLLETAAECHLPTLRFYRWSEPTLSLGYFQPYADRSFHRDSGACAIVRRPTGGGAILHDQELTYSLALSASHPLARQTTELYDAFHETLLSVLHAAELMVELNALPAGEPSAASPFLCFQKHVTGDVMLAGFKICGSAERRRRGAILQHGSLLLARSTAAREVPGILELAGVQLRDREVQEAWRRELADRLGFRMVSGELSTAERNDAARLAAEKYASPSWTERR